MTSGSGKNRPNDDLTSPGNGFFVPDLCRVRSVFMLVVSSELMALLLAMAHARGQWIDWSYFGLVSMLVQWTVLTCAALICLARPWLSRRSTAGATLAMVVLVAVDVVVFSSLASTFIYPEPGPERWQATGKSLLIAVIATLMVLRYFYLQHQWRQQKQAEMTYRLTALQARIHPHFLFNSMNTIASLISTRPEQAEDAVLDLSELFRASLRTSERLVPLSEELGLCRRYLALEQLRLGDRLTVEWRTDPTLANQAIPPLTLQPLVENAIYHGIQPRTAGGTIVIESQRSGDYVYLLVQNPLPEPGAQEHQGNRVAFSNTQARIQALFGETAVLKNSRQENRYTVTLRLPWQTVSRYP
ncbi:two-component system, LytT family, sensor histidine kinase AlgZ [Marinobacter daqiaonensis]|uniref:Two-component system, LytT family, sensor histidine kinase AlgZ n=1 Tax=Marinobacter daqiaonensis TaxID=650891 RepID=A0A1I6JU66_9GAMM|nr:sensor histidine kinase [Marinobacter daqiaonensis]SFR82487.1 two-component system, LytT family, sensor histidine kinase AlgZ [Marinobacter daqiaonensis]